MDYSKIGERIRAYRKLRKFSQEQLAEKINISPTHMSHIETGSTKLSLPVLVDIAQVLNVSTDTLLFESPRSNAPELLEVLSTCSKKQLEIIAPIVQAAVLALEKL